MDDKQWPSTAAMIRMAEHKPGDRITIRWPRGYYDYEIEFESIQPERSRPGWYWIRGWVVSPVGAEHQQQRTFFVEAVGDEYALTPKRD